MWLISTWTCIWLWLWLLLKLSMVGGVALECYACSGDASCKSKPYNTVECADNPNSVCIVISGGPGIANVNNDHILNRQCATREFVGQMGGSTDHCKNTGYDRLKAGDDWIQTTPDVGMRLQFGLDNVTWYRICACRGPQRCNERIEDHGVAYGTGPIKENTDKPDTNGNEGDGGCKCGAAAALHFLSSVAFGSVPSFMLVWRAVHSHTDGI